MADWNGQRKVIGEQILALTGELREAADKRAALVLDVQLGKADPHDLDSLEQGMAAATTKKDRLAASLAEIDKREADDEAKAEAAERAKAEARLADLQAQRQRATVRLINELPAVAAIAEAALSLEREEEAVARSLGQTGAYLLRQTLALYIVAEFHSMLGHGVAAMPPHAIPAVRKRALAAVS